MSNTQASPEWEKALVSLTPGGSEFCGDANYCVKYVKEFQASQHKFICELIKEKNQLREALQEAPIVSMFSKAEDFISAYENWRDRYKNTALKGTPFPPHHKSRPQRQ